MLEKFAFEKTKRERENMMRETENSHLKSVKPESGERDSFWFKVKSVFMPFLNGSEEQISSPNGEK